MSRTTRTSGVRTGAGTTEVPSNANNRSSEHPGGSLKDRWHDARNQRRDAELESLLVSVHPPGPQLLETSRSPSLLLPKSLNPAHLCLPSAHRPIWHTCLDLGCLLPVCSHLPEFFYEDHQPVGLFSWIVLGTLFFEPSVNKIPSLAKFTRGFWVASGSRSLWQVQRILWLQSCCFYLWRTNKKNHLFYKAVSFPPRVLHPF